MASPFRSAAAWAGRHDGLLVGLIFVSALLLLVPLGATYEYVTDEGYNLAKADLVARGYSLYEQVWSDQPPVLAYILAGTQSVFGQSILAARLVIVGFSALLLWAFYRTLRLDWGRFEAVAAAVFLAQSTFYWYLSYWVLIGLPALALAMVSIFGVVHYAHRRRGWALVVSGLALGCSMNTKFFTSFLAPLLLAYLIYVQYPRVDQKAEETPPRRRWHAPVLWLAAFLLAFGGIGFLAFWRHSPQLIGTHLEGKSAYGHFPSFSFVAGLLVSDLHLCLFGLTLLPLLIRRHPRRLLLPAVWLLLALLILLNHKPVWFRHYLLLSPPLAWLAGIGFAHYARFVIRLERERRAGGPLRAVDVLMVLIVFGMAVTTILYIPPKLDMIGHYYDRETEAYYERVVGWLEEHGSKTQWVLTDSPIFPWFADLPVPPELAVPSQKRMLTGQITYEDFVRIMEDYDPEQVLLARPALFDTPQVMYIHRRYVLAHREGEVLHYVRPDIYGNR